MTISASRTRELDINTICARAMQLAGFMNPQESTSAPQFAPKLAMAMDFLDTICKQLQSTAIIERHCTRTSAAVTATVATVTLTSSVKSVLGDMTFLPTGDTIETPVMQIDQHAYNSIVEKTSQGTPTMGYVSRQPTPTVTLWQVPNVNGALWYVQHILAADVSNAAETVDFERHWTAYLMWELAFWLSTSGGGAGRRDLAAKAEKLFETAASYSAAQRPIQMRVAHRIPR